MPTADEEIGLMSNVGILLGNVTYQSLNKLDCCREDVAAMEALLAATGKYEVLRSLVDSEADAMKAAIRETLAAVAEVDEVLFYFSGHGVQRKSEFYFCATNFDGSRPNETGLSTSELHTLLRSCNPKLVVKVIDACNSGTSLIKAEESVFRIQKGELGDFIQIASCLDSQGSLTSHPLSQFTQSFCQAALRKVDGSVYYTDVINSLRDDYIGDEYQTPHFVSQGTGREVFVEDASRLSSFRDRFEKQWVEIEDSTELVPAADDSVEQRQTMLTLISNAEEKFGTQDEAKEFISDLFDGIIERVGSTEFTDFFDVKIDEHSNFREDAVKPFIVRCLARERRPDNFVEASVGRLKKRRPIWESSMVSAMLGDEYLEHLDLELNCPMPRIQLKVLFVPKFGSLNQLSLIMTCAPSLNSCYIFEVVREHLRTGWSSFDEEGGKVVENWYERLWSEDISWLVEASCDRLLEAVRKHVEQTNKRLAESSSEGE